MDFFTVCSNILKEYWKDFLKGVGWTLLISLISTIIGLIIGLIIGIVRTNPEPKNNAKRVLRKILDFILSAYIEIFRGTPMMVQAMVIYWGYAFATGTTLNLIGAAILIVSINTGAYIAEIVRGGIISIDKGQFEGAGAIGMTHLQTMVYVVIPQVLRNILPSVANEFVINIKDTSVLNVIGVTELYFFARVSILESGVAFGKNFQVYLIICVIYFILTFSITRLLRLIEKKLDGGKNYQIVGSQNMDAESFVKEQDLRG